MNLKEFVNPPKCYRPSPFWSWNHVMEAGEIENRIRDMKRKGFGGFIIHPRTGLRTQYLSDDWMRAVRRSVETARESEMECWLFDEDKGPSGYGGGKTSEDNDENLAVSLTWIDDASTLDNNFHGKILAYTKKNTDGTVQLLQEKPDDLTGAGVFIERRFSRGHFWFNGENYVDLLNPGTVQTFIDNTHERYSKLFRYDFGEFMPGIFTAEPNVNRNVKVFEQDEKTQFSFPWSLGFAEFFENFHGYSPLDQLHHLLNNNDDGFKFRHDFWLAVNERFLNAFTIPLSTWCREHDLLFTGHYLSSDGFFHMISSGGTVMTHYEYMDIPGIDHMGRTINNPWTIKQVTSVVNQLGKKRAVCKIFGATGHSLSFEEMKWIADFYLALGITFISPHLVQFSMMGERKRDFPTTFSYHQPYWEHIRVMNDYLGRSSWAVSMGRSTASILIMVPICSAYGVCDMSVENGGEILSSIEHSYHALVDEFIAEHIPFDLGDERIVRRHGNADGTVLTVGNSVYTAVILPPSITWRASTLDILQSFTGTVIIMGDVPVRVDGVPDERITEFLKRGNCIIIPDNPLQASQIIAGKIGRNFNVTDNDGSQVRSVLVNHRVDAGAHVLFLTNTDRKESKDVTITVNALGGVVELDPLSGRAFRYTSEIKDNRSIIKTTLYPSGSRIFLIDQTQTSVISQSPQLTEESLTIEGPYTFQRLNDNTLTIDRCSLEIDGKTILKNEPVWKAKRAIWKANGIEEYWGYQPWVIEKKNIRTRTNQTVLTFTFTVKEIPDTVFLAMECADRFTVKINGSPVEPTPGKWHIDKRFSVLNLATHLKEGINTITAATDFLWDTEIEDIYIFGDFAVGSEEDCFPIKKEPEALNTGNWVEQGYPFFTGSITYKMEFDIEFNESELYEIDLSGAKGSIFYVTVNGTEIGAVPFPPYRAEVSGALKQGTNTLEIEVISSLRNTFGPFHHTAGESLVITGPEQFTDESNWTDSYRFAAYGFIEPPKLIKITAGE